MDLAVEAGRRDRKLRILVTRLRFLGDVIISTPVIHELKRRYADAEIYYLSQPGYADILKADPALAGIIELGSGVSGFIKTIFQLRKLRPLAAVDLFYNPASALLLYLSGIPVRIGGKRRLREIFYTDPVKVPLEIRSAVDHNLYFLRKAGIEASGSVPRVYLSEDDREKGRSSFAGLKSLLGGAERIVAIHPGGTWASKRWPAERFSSLVDLLKRGYGTGSILISGPGEEEIADKISALSEEGAAILPIGPIEKAASVIDLCDAVIANDGGIMHLAVALGKPVTAIFGPTDPGIWFPYPGKGPFSVVTAGAGCSPCDLHICYDMNCMEKIGVDDVIEKILSVTGW